MAIADTTLLLEGQRDFSGGMDSSKAPNLIAPNSVSRAVNVTFRGGTPTTRPGFNQLVLANAQADANGGLDYFVNGLFQGSYFYQDRRAGYNPCLFSVMSGHIVKINLGTYEVQRVFPVVAAADVITGQEYIVKTVGTTNWTTCGGTNTVGVTFTATSSAPTGDGTAYSKQPIDIYSDCYFVQAENFLIIQDAINLPRIWDGDNLWISTKGPTKSIGAISGVPIGTVMAYGQGRLFVANPDRTTGTAGDLAYGGSTDQIAITSGAGAGGASTYVLTTATWPSSTTFQAGNLITISGHSSSNGANGTWTVKSVTTSPAYTITIDLANPSSASTATSGTGGYVAKANAGSASDLLRFTETTYLDEGGSLQVPGFLGKITGMIFMPVQDSGAGQGDLLVFCETGVLSLSVAVPRSQWKSTVGFQRIALASVGSTGQESLATANGDVFFRSFDGLRTYRNARAEFNSFGRVPISAEMNGVLDYDTKSMLKNCSCIVFDNRFLFTATPQITYKNISTSQLTKRPITFSTIVALDFTTLASIGAQRASCYDGMWRGLDVTKLVTGVVQGKPRAFAFCVDYNVNATNTIWELSPDNFTDQPVNSEAVPITSILETRSFQLGSPAEVKKLIRSDLWLGSLRGNTNFKVYWRPDEYACWRPWHEFSRCATVDNCVKTGVGTEFNAASNTVTIGFYTSTIKWYRILVPSAGGSVYTVPLKFTNSDNATADSLVIANALTAAGIAFSTVTRSGTYPVISYTVTGALGDFTIIPVKDQLTVGTGDCQDMFAPKNLQPQYRPQVRMPTPPADSDPVVGRPYYFGNDFQFRIEWAGHAQLTRLLVLGQRQLEQYQGTDYVEVV